MDNISQQSFKDIELVIVDDCSETPCEEAVSHARELGLATTLVRNEIRLYTKEARLVGVESARGRFIMFIDADDLLFQTQPLEYHIKLAPDSDADIVHFSAVHYEDGEVSKREFAWVQPFAENLNGSEIFNAYTACDCGGSTIWGKIIKKELWEKCLIPARESSVRRYGEDLFFPRCFIFMPRAMLAVP